MRLIAKKPCNFGGRKFFIGNEVPVDLVADPKVQERLGVLAIVNADDEGVPDGQSGTLFGQMFTQEEVDNMIAAAVEKVTAETQQQPGAYGGTVQITVKGEDGVAAVVLAKPEEIQQTFSIMQLNAEEGAKAIANVINENVLILLHATDSRKTIKNAAKEQADNIFPASGNPNEYTGGNATTGTTMEGADT